ncbi:MAG TPA: VOC family protein [Planosporangium sp.]|jgi:predicted enzyme related to lactoylglutathione lyase|nr:VOC family protein [Planosporangium sp.]
MVLKPGMVTIDCADPQALAAFWTEAAGYRVAADHGVFVQLMPADGGGLSIGLQQVPEPRVGKNRVHVDFHADDREVEIGRLVGLGATVLGEQQVPGLRWTVLADPEGNEFCVAG